MREGFFCVDECMRREYAKKMDCGTMLCAFGVMPAVFCRENADM